MPELSQALALDFGVATSRPSRALCYAVIRRFAVYHAAFDLAASRSIDALCLAPCHSTAADSSDEDLRSLMAASQQISVRHPLRGRTLATVIGLLASTGLRSGEALRLDRSDVDLANGVLQIRKTKFRKDRLVPVHVSTLTALQGYVGPRDLAFPTPKPPAFFVSTRGTRLSSSGLYYGFARRARHERACSQATSISRSASSVRRHASRRLASTEGRCSIDAAAARDIPGSRQIQRHGLLHHSHVGAAGLGRGDRGAA
jgi:integrase